MGKFVLKEVNGDLFSAKTSIGNCVGADLKMGAGIAVKFKQLFGGEEELRKQNVKTGGCAVLKVKDRYIYYLVTKDKSGTGFYPTYESLESSLKAMHDHMIKNNVTELAIPQIGCGIDGLKWEEVETRIRNVFNDSDIEITVYKYVPNSQGIVWKLFCFSAQSVHSFIMGLDYYAILDVPRTARIHDIKLAYRKLALRLHPQRENYPQHPIPRPQGTFDLPLPTLPEKTYWEVLNEVYDVLSNPLYREVFDQYGEEWLKCGTAAPNVYIAPYSYHGDFIRTFCEFFGSFSPYADLIDAVTNPPLLYNTEEGIGVKHKDPTVEYLLHLELEEVFHGGLKLVKIFLHDFIDELKTKTEEKEVTITVKFAAGILEGTELVFPEAGDRSPTRIPGDVKFVVCDTKHNTFRREKSDLHIDYKISLKEALTGFKMTIKTIDDRILNILITDVIECNHVKRIESEGLTNPSNNNLKGDLLVHFLIEFPTFIPKQLRRQLADVFDDVEAFNNEDKKNYSCRTRDCQSSAFVFGKQL